jgi:hypothetical protein
VVGCTAAFVYRRLWDHDPTPEVAVKPVHTPVPARILGEYSLLRTIRENIARNAALWVPSAAPRHFLA